MPIFVWYLWHRTMSIRRSMSSRHLQLVSHEPVNIYRRPNKFALLMWLISHAIIFMRCTLNTSMEIILNSRICTFCNSFTQRKS